MAVAAVLTDTWIQHLPFVGGPRRTPFGDMDGTFQGVMAATGDASGGNVTMSGRLSEERKEDWVYVIGGAHTRVSALAAIGDVFQQVNTGPLIPTATTVQNATYEWGGVTQPIGGNAIAIAPAAGIELVQGMPIYGDKRIAGVFLMYAAGWETNVDLAIYSSQIWGWIIRYSSFFRDTRPSLG